MARPKFKIDYDAVRKLASIMCTQQEIAGFLGCDERTLQRDEELCRVYKEAKETGKMSLRRMQWKLAEKSYAMAIFLGKQYLGQRDTFEVDNTNEISKVEQLLARIKDEATNDTK